MPKAVIKNKVVRSLFRKAAKTEVIIFRLSRADKNSIRSAAKSVNISMTEYLTNLHRFVIISENKAKSTIIGNEVKTI